MDQSGMEQRRDGLPSGDEEGGSGEKELLVDEEDNSGRSVDQPPGELMCSEMQEVATTHRSMQLTNE